MLPEPVARVTGAGGLVPESSWQLLKCPVRRRNDPQGDDRKVDQNFSTPEEDAGCPLEHSGVKEGGRPEYGMTEFDCTTQEEEIVSHPLEHSGVVEWVGVTTG